MKLTTKKICTSRKTNIWGQNFGESYSYVIAIKRNSLCNLFKKLFNIENYIYLRIVTHMRKDSTEIYTVEFHSTPTYVNKYKTLEEAESVIKNINDNPNNYLL